MVLGMMAESCGVADWWVEGELVISMEERFGCRIQVFHVFGRASFTRHLFCFSFFCTIKGFLVNEIASIRG